MKKMLSVSLLVLTLAVLPACDWFDKKSEAEDQKVEAPQEPAVKPEEGKEGEAAEEIMQEPAGEVEKKSEMSEDILISMNGKPVVTMDDLEQDYKQVLEERPELASFEPFVKANLLQSLVTQAIVDRYVEDRGIQKTAEYKKELDNMTDRLRRVLNVKYFRDAHPVEVSNAEVKEYYEKNKETFPDLIIERGGVETMAVSFDKEADAKAFLSKAKAAPKNFEKLAQAEHKDNFRDFKLVNPQSPGVDPVVKNAIADLKSFPNVQMVKAADGTFWVVNATEKKESKYRPLDEQVKEGLRQYMVQEKQMKVMEEKMAELKDQYKIEVNDSALKQNMPTQAELEESLGMLDPEAMMAEAELEAEMDQTRVA